MQKNVREIAVIMQDKEKEYKICEKLRRHQAQLVLVIE